MKAYKTYQSYEKTGMTPKGRAKKGYVNKKEEIELAGLVKFADFDTQNLRKLEKDLEELGLAVSTILLSDPEKFRSYFQSRVDLINETNIGLAYGYSENARYDEKIILE